jgi:N-acetylglucosamine-6-phosphate deacetylase
MALLIQQGTVLLADGFHAETDIRIDDGVIDRIGTGLTRAGAEILAARGLTVAPGFLDVHIHGAAGATCEDADAGGLERISAALARCGVTGFLATLATLPAATLEAAVRTIAATAPSLPGAQILGIHLEGPYLNPVRAGAQAIRHMRPPSIEEFDRLQDLCGGLIRLITVAPELPAAVPFIAAVRERGVAVSLGHSDATAADVLLAVEAGATHATHLFNAMRPLHHREPGIVGTALTDDSLSVELIADGHHVAPRMIDLTFRCKPGGKTVLVSDAVAALGLPDGACTMFGIECIIADGAVRLREGGMLAGSCLSLDRAVRNVRHWLPDLPLAQLLAAASAAPAAVIGEHGRGTIAVGQRADLVLLDGTLTVVATVCCGRVVWRQ